MEDLEGAYNDALSAEGSALRENASHLDSIQGRVDLFNNAIQTMWMNFIDTGVAKGLVDIGTALIKIIDTVGLLPSAVGAFTLLKSSISNIKIELEALKNGTSSVSGAFKKMSDDTVNSVRKQVQAETEKQDATKDSTLATEEQMVIEGMENQVTKQGATDDLLSAGAKNKETKATWGQVTAEKALAAAKGLAKGLLTGLATFAITAVITNLAESIMESAKTMDELTDSAITSGNQLNDARDSLEDYKDEIKELRTTLEDSNTSEQEAYDARARLIEIQNELAGSYGKEVENINLVTGAIDAQIAKLDELSKKKAAAWFLETDDKGNSNQKAYDNAVNTVNEKHDDIELLTHSLVQYYSDVYDDATGTYNKTLKSQSYSGNLGKLSDDVVKLYYDGMEQIIKSYGGTIEGRLSEYESGDQSTKITSYFASFEDKTAEEINEIFQEINAYLDQFSIDYQVDMSIQKNHLAAVLKKYVDEDYQKAKELYDIGNQQRAISAYNAQYGAIRDSQGKIQDATDNEGRLAAIREYSEAVDSAISATVNQETDEIFDVAMNNFFTAMRDKFAQEEFELRIKTNDNALRTNLENIIKESGETGLSVLDDNQMKDLADKYSKGYFYQNSTGRYVDQYSTGYNASQISGIAQLQAQADAAGISVNTLIETLVNLGYISGRPLDATEVTEASSQAYSTLVETVSGYTDVTKVLNEAIYDNIEISEEQYNTLKELIGSEEGFADCIDTTNGYIVTNAKKLKELTANSKNSTAQNIKLAKSQARLKYYELYKQMRTLTNGKKIENAATLEQVNSIYKEMSALQQVIAQYSLLEHKLLGTSNAYEKLAEAQEIDSSIDYGSQAEEMVNVLANAFNTSELGTQAAQVAIEGLIPDDVIDKTKALDDQMQQIYSYFTKGTISKLFTIEFDDDGGISSVEMTKKNVEAFTKSLIGSAEEGAVFQGTWDEFTLNPAITSLKDFADEIGTTEEIAFAYLTSLEKYDISWLGGDYTTLLDQLMGDDFEYQTQKNIAALADLEHQMANGTITAEEYATKYAELSQIQDENNKKIKDNATAWASASSEVDTAKKRVEDVTAELNALKDSGATEQRIALKTEQLQEASNQLSEALKKKYGLQEPTDMTIQIALDEANKEIEQFKAENSVLLTKIQIEKDENGNHTYTVNAGVNLSNEEKAKVDTYMQSLNDQYTITVLADENPEDSSAELKEVQSAAEAAKKAIEEIPDPKINTNPAITAINDLQTAIDNIKGKTVDIHETTYKKTVYSWGLGSSSGEDSVSSSGEDSVNGTHVNGTAYQSGSWGAAKTETALVGELGPELLVRGSQWTTIGDNGAEFTQIKKGDIIFNHKQTEDLLSKGYISGRGKLKGGHAFASGTAYASINTWDDAYGTVYKDYSNLGSSIYDAADSISNAADEFKEVFDWIEVRLEELDETLSMLSAKLENASNYVSKNEILDKMIAMNESKITNLVAGIQEYDKYAEKLLQEVPTKYHEAVKDGAIAIEQFAGETDEATLEAINNYREWAQKADDLRQQLEEVNAEIRDLAIQKFDNAYEYGNVRATVEDSQTEKLQNAVDYDEERGLITSDEYYIAMMENSNKKIEYLTNARKAMQEELDAAVEAGHIERGSNEWYELINQMYEIDASIDEATIELEEFQNAINDLYWDNLEQLTNRLDNLKNETQSLINLMDNADMVIDPQKRRYENGTVEYWTADDVDWTDEGITSLGLYAQQMEIAEYTSRQYAEAINDLEKDYNAGLYSENEYLEKLNELKEAQYDSIEAYQDAKEAIVDLNKARIDTVKDGIEKEIEAYEELIEKQKEALDAEKDLHGFQKSVMDQQKNISDLERQLAALAGDNSASARAKRAKLEAELAEANAELDETYYDRSVSNQQEALDKELENFKEEKDKEIDELDKYLENVEQVVADSLMIVQTNASTVYDTLNAKADEYNLNLSESILEPWKDGALAVSDYQSTFDTSMSSTMDQLEELKAKWQEVIDTMQEAAKVDIDAINTENKNYASATKKEEAKKEEPKKEETKKEEAQKPSLTKGSYIEVKPGTKWYADSYGGGASGNAKSGTIKYVNEKGSHPYNIDGAGWVKKSDIKGYAKGTKNLEKSGIVNIDELGEELVLRAQNGRLTYLEKGSGVIPADLTSNLMEWGKLDPSIMLDENRPKIDISPEVHNTEIKLDCSVGTLLHIDEFNGDNPEDIAKLVAKEFDKYTKNLNNALRKYAR